MGKYKVRSVYKPGQSNEAALAVVEQMDARFFPGAQAEPLRETYWWFVYDEDGNIVGYAGMRYISEDKYGYFSRAGVDMAHRKQGIHKRLINTRIKLAKKLGGDCVLTYVATHNNASMNALVSRGFRAYTPERRWAGPEFLYLQLEFKSLKKNGTKKAKKKRRNKTK